MNRVKSYRLTNNRSGEDVIIKSGIKGNLTVLTEESVTGAKGKKETRKIRKAIRHCPNQRSVFIEEQDAHALVEPVIFKNGYLHVPETQPITIEFLDYHPSNVRNGGIWFEEVNEEKEAEESLAREDLVLELRYRVKEMSENKDKGLQELSAVVAVLENNIDRAATYGMQQLRRIINNAIDEDPYAFTDDNGNINIFEDFDSKRKFIVLKALKDGFIKKSINSRTMLWGNTGKEILTCPVGIDLIDYFADYLETDEGKLIIDKLI